jgi:AbrB family looped-hinge helix DNA binding protein
LKTSRKSSKDLLSFTCKIDSKGRILVPKEIRRIFKLSSGSSVKAILEEVRE